MSVSIMSKIGNITFIYIFLILWIPEDSGRYYELIDQQFTPKKMCTVG